MVNLGNYLCFAAVLKVGVSFNVARNQQTFSHALYLNTSSRTHVLMFLIPGMEYEVRTTNVDVFPCTFVFW